MATWFDDGDPAEQPVEDPAVVIHVPFLCSGGGTSDLRRSGRCCEHGGRLLPPCKNSRSLTAARFVDNNPAAQLEQDSPAIICAPLPCREAAEFNLNCRGTYGDRLNFGGRYGERSSLCWPRRCCRTAARLVDNNPANQLEQDSPALICAPLPCREGAEFNLNRRGRYGDCLNCGGRYG